MTEKKKETPDIKTLYGKYAGVFWERLFKGHIHSGICEPGEDIPIHEAAMRFTDMLIEKVPLKEGQRFLDVGCGVGLPALELVKRKGCQVDGVNITSEQVEQANETAQRENLEHLAKFYVADAIKLPFEENTFDGGWFFDSISHMPRQQVYREACRTLKPGSFLFVTDSGIPKELLTQEDNHFLINELFITSPTSKKDYPDLLKKTGFELVEFKELSYVNEMTFRKIVEGVEEYRDDLLKMGGNGLYDYLRDFMWKMYEIYGKKFDCFLIIVKKR